MKYTVAVAALVASVSAQAVTQAITPSGPAVCSESYPGPFEIYVVNASDSSQASLEKRSAFVLTLKGGELHDNNARTGYIASNHQFQFDKPPQAGAIYTAGWSVCQNGSLALQSSVFYKCNKGDTYDLYDKPSAAECSPVHINILPQNGATVTGVTADSTLAPPASSHAAAATSSAPVTSAAAPSAPASSAPATSYQPVPTTPSNATASISAFPGGNAAGHVERVNLVPLAIGALAVGLSAFFL